MLNRHWPRGSGILWLSCALSMRIIKCFSVLHWISLWLDYRAKVGCFPAKYRKLIEPSGKRRRVAQYGFPLLRLRRRRLVFVSSCLRICRL